MPHRQRLIDAYMEALEAERVLYGHIHGGGPLAAAYDPLPLALWREAVGRTTAAAHASLDGYR